MERAGTTASSLEAEHDSGSGHRCQDTILGDVNAQTRFEITSIQSIDPPLSRGYTLGSGEDKRQNDDIMFDSEVLRDEVMHVKLKLLEKINRVKKSDDILLIKAAKLKVVTTAATTTTTSRPKDRGVVESKEKKEEGREETARGSRKKMLGRKRAGKEQQKESSKKQKVEEGQELEEVDEVELKKLLVIKKDEDIAIDAIPLATKLPVIIDYKLHKEGMLVHYQLIRADGSSKRYSSMIRMLQGIDREDLESLWRIVKVKHGDTRPENEFERVLYGDLKVMFEPNIKSDIWRMLQGYRVTIWKLIDSSRVQFVRFDNLHIFMLVERRYPLTPITITNMLNKKLQTDHQNEMY
ncbi:hypothetical protein Tco_0764940 [Tanacetum coccineum]